MLFPHHQLRLPEDTAIASNHPTTNTHPFAEFADVVKAAVEAPLDDPRDHVQVGTVPPVKISVVPNVAEMHVILSPTMTCTSSG